MQPPSKSPSESPAESPFTPRSTPHYHITFENVVILPDGTASWVSLAAESSPEAISEAISEIISAVPCEVVPDFDPLSDLDPLPTDLRQTPHPHQ
ncbi:MAG: hypothetical protein MUF49_00005, partial [Oculatellaceae cyanobacterium Prado106]|nr:hypothetical protein [Oculatellaceae cyanobacterium Prado106]